MAPSRIQSLDQFRGYTVAGMFFVNFAGGFAAIPAVLKHHNTYCSYADTIMPQFFFAVGFALRLVLLRNIGSMGGRAAYGRALRRIAALAVVALVFYNLSFDENRWFGLLRPSWTDWAVESFWRDSFQTLLHIAVASLWVLPVTQLWVADISQTFAQFHRNRPERRRRSGGGSSRWRLNLALPKLDPGDCLVAKKTVHPLNDLGNHVADDRCVSRNDDQLEDAIDLFAGRKANCLGRANPGVARSHDLGPAGDHA